MARKGSQWRQLPDEYGKWNSVFRRYIAPYHNRQIVLLGPGDWARWLDASVPAQELCQPLPPGSLDVVRVR